MKLNNLLGIVFAVSVVQKVLLPFCYQIFISATKLLSIFYCLVKCVANDRDAVIYVLSKVFKDDPRFICTPSTYYELKKFQRSN